MLLEVMFSLPSLPHPHHPPHSPSLALSLQVLQSLYESDVVSEEAVVAWAEEKKFASEQDRVFLDKAAPFIKVRNEGIRGVLQ